MKSKEARPAQITAIVVLICACACVVSTIVALATMGLVYGMPPAAGDVLTYLYQINAFFCMAAILFVAALLFMRTRRAIVAKSALWAMLILSIMYVTPFMTDTIAYLGSMSFLPAFRYACAYLPFAALIVSIVAVLTTWAGSTHRTASVICMACSLCAVFCGIVYLWQVGPAALDAQTQFDQAQICAIVAGFVAVMALPIVLWFGSLSERTWLETLIGVDAQDAPFAAEASKRLESVRETMIDRIRAEYEKKNAASVDAAPPSDETQEPGQVASAEEVVIAAEETVAKDAAAPLPDTDKNDEDSAEDGKE